MNRTLPFIFMAMIALPAAAEENVVSGKVATIAGQAVTEQELGASVGNKLMRVKTEEYNIRRAALDELIADRLLRAEAASRKVSVEELLRVEVDAKVSVPSASDLESFYEGVKNRFTGIAKDEALQQIAEGMRKQQAEKKKQEFVKKLRTAAQVAILIQPPRAAVKAEGPSRGNADAAVTIVEFSDFECQFCGRAVETLHKLRDQYGDKVRIVFRDFPLPSHRGAARAAEAAHCANEQEKFWDMHDRLFARGGAVGNDAELRKAAADAGLNADSFDVCLASGKYGSAWKASREDGVRAGVLSTPTFFINGRMLVGAVSFEMFRSLIDDELERLPHPPAAVAVSAGSR